MLKRILAILHARNLEFIRDRGSVAWNVLLPIILVFGLAAVFSGDERAEYTVGVLQSTTEFDESLHPFFATRFVEFIVQADQDVALRKVSRHKIDLLVRPGDTPRYWVNPQSPKGYILERVLLQADTQSIEKEQISGDAIRYVDWVLPGILGMNMMFSCLFGVGYVVVRYRKSGFLKRLRATPLRAIEFILAQIGSRLLLVISVTSFVFLCTSYFLGVRMEGSYLALLLVAIIGSVNLISIGLMIAARVSSEELAGGLLNMVTWPMMMLSGVWFSLEGASAWIQQLARAFPLTLILESARAIMLDGAGLLDVVPQLLILTLMSAVFLSIGAALFRWRQI